MVHDIDLIEEDEAVKHTERRIIEDTSENDIFEVEQAVRPMDLVPDMLVLNGDDFFEL